MKSKAAEGTIAICEELRKIIYDYRRSLKTLSLWVFLAKRDDSKSFNAGNWNKRFHDLLKESVYQPMRFYDLRHSFVTWYMNGLRGEPTDLNAIARHSRYQTTIDLYGHIIKSHFDEEVGRINSYIEHTRENVNS